MITDDVVGVDTLTDKTGATVMTEATVKVHIGGRRVVATAEGNGPVNALDTALRTALNGNFPALERVHLTDYKVRVLDTNKGTGAATRVLIDSTDGDATWTTIGVNENIIEASWQALLDSIHFGLLAGRASRRLRDRLAGPPAPSNVGPRADRSVRPVRSECPAAPAAEPAAGVALPPANDWRSDRPGDLGPDQPEGALFGRPGPNVGYAYTLAQRAKDRLRLGPFEHADDAIAVDRRDRGQAGRAVRPRAGDRRRRSRDRGARLRRQRERRRSSRRAPRSCTRPATTTAGGARSSTRCPTRCCACGPPQAAEIESWRASMPAPAASG